MGLLEVLGIRSAVAGKTEGEPEKKKDISAPQGAIAQLVGANWVSPLFDPGYGLEKHLPLFFDPGPDGTPANAYKSLSGGSGRAWPGGRLYYDQNYLKHLTISLSFTVTYYGQDVEGFNMFMWKGVRMNGLPVFTGFTAERTEEEIREIWAYGYRSYGLTSKPVLTLASGNSGWTTLEAGLQAIPAPDSKVIWVATVDSPHYPKDEEPNEASVLLMLAHPGTDTGRKPLAYFTAPVVRPLPDARPRDKEPRRIAALREAIEQACAAAGLEPKAIGSVVTDCGRHTPAASRSLGEVAAALDDLKPDFDVTKDRIDMPAFLGELGANTVSISLILGAYAAHRRNHPVLYVSNVDSQAARAMLVLPPPDHTPPDPYRPFREHTARGQWYAPWWGQRLDGKKDY